MSTSFNSFPADTPRVNYHDGILLGAADFQEEQVYHRARLAAALTALHGFGTVAGLKVERFAAGTLRPEDGQPRAEEELIVNPGLALDRSGRVIEVRKKQGLRLARWFTQKASGADGSFTPLLDADTHQRFFVGEIFLKFQECPQGLRPSFPEAAADATDTVVAARTQEWFELVLVARDCDPPTQLPPVPTARFSPKPANRRALLDQLYAAYDSVPAAEYLPGFDDPTAVLLSRVLIRLTDDPATDLQRHASGDVVINDLDRPVVTPTDLLATLLHQS